MIYSGGGGEGGREGRTGMGCACRRWDGVEGEGREGVKGRKAWKGGREGRRSTLHVRVEGRGERGGKQRIGKQREEEWETKNKKRDALVVRYGIVSHQQVVVNEMAGAGAAVTAGASSMGEGVICAGGGACAGMLVKGGGRVGKTRTSARLTPTREEITRAESIAAQDER
jgi:hypothetical protein